MQGNEHSASLPTHVSDSNQKVAGTKAPTKRVYRVWKGSNTFFFGGRLIFGPDVRSMVITIFLIVIPLLLFAVFVSRNLVREFKNHLGNLIIIIPCILAAYIIVSLFLTSGRDPGIIPRNRHPPEPEDDSEGSKLSSVRLGAKGGVQSLPLFKDVIVNGIEVRVKYCHTCMLYRPPRCSHCSICDNCVERFDHHCPWVGQCIGKRNYRFFYMFVSSTTMLCLYVFFFCWVNLVKFMGAYHCNFWRALLKSPMSGLLIIYTFIAAWFIGGLTAFHTYLICTNQTTYESFRYRYDGSLKNPYNQGCLKNVMEIFFSRIPKSQVKFRARVKSDVSAFYSLSHGRTESSKITKTGVDLETNGKRQAVVAEEFDDLHNQNESLNSLERCGTQAPRTSWEVTGDIEALEAEFGTEHASTAREKIEGIL